MDLLKDNTNTIYDRFNLGEAVYPIVYGREAKTNISEQEEIMKYCETLNIPYIIFYSSDFSVLKDRLFNRGDTEEVLYNAEKINNAFKYFALQLKDRFSNVHIIDISKENDQIEWFKNNIEKEIL